MGDLSPVPAFLAIDASTGLVSATPTATDADSTISNILVRESDDTDPLNTTTYPLSINVMACPSLTPTTDAYSLSTV